MSIIIIGAGHNGLTAAFCLARAGLKPVVVERRSIVGGAAVTEALAPGFRCPTLAHATGPLRESVVRDMRLPTRGVEFIRPQTRLLTFASDGRALAFSADESKTAEAIRAFSPADAAQYPDFCATLSRIGGFIGGLLDKTPPSLNGPAAGELWDLLKTGRRFRALGRTDGFRILRWMPMAVADLVAEWFSTDVLRAAVAARGIFGASQGPWSAGTGAVITAGVAAAMASSWGWGSRPSMAAASAVPITTIPMATIPITRRAIPTRPRAAAAMCATASTATAPTMCAPTPSAVTMATSIVAEARTATDGRAVL